jgi:hypothetical protein
VGPSGADFSAPPSEKLSDVICWRWSSWLNWREHARSKINETQRRAAAPKEQNNEETTFMHQLLIAVPLALAAALAGVAPLNAAPSNYDESVSGDLSGTPASPTPWTLGEGANVLKGGAGSVFGPVDVVDNDLVAFTVPAGLQLNSIGITSFDNEFGQTFFGLQPGSTWLDGLGNEMSGSYLIGYALINSFSTPPDLLARLQDGVLNPPALKIPLPSGTYVLEMQDVDTTFSYELSFNVGVVPEPAAGSLALLAACGYGVRRRRGIRRPEARTHAGRLRSPGKD